LNTTFKLALGFSLKNFLTSATAISAARSFGNLNSPVLIQQKAILLRLFSKASFKEFL